VDPAVKFVLLVENQYSKVSVLLILAILLVELVDILFQVCTLMLVLFLEKQLLSEVNVVLVVYVDWDHRQELEVRHFLLKKQHVNKKK
jgi:hypothetical protein